MMVWNDQKYALLLELKKQGLSYEEIGNRLGCSRCAISGKLNRNKNIRAGVEPHKKGPPKGSRPSNPHNNTIEPWAEYSARKKKEREQQKAKGAFHIYQSAGRTLGK